MDNCGEGTIIYNDVGVCWQESVKNLPKDNFLVVYFEELIKNYDIEINKIFSFLEINKKYHIRKQSIFNPNISSKNIGIWNEVLSKKESSFIEQEFKNYYTKF